MSNLASKSLGDIDGWVHETRFGIWFQGTRIWDFFVLRTTFKDIKKLVGQDTGVRNVLDIGCGEGRAFELLDAQFHPDRIIGIDADPDLVARGGESARKCGPHVEIRRGDAQNIELSDNSVDLVFCHQTFHHLTFQEKAAREIYRVLAPGGVLLFAESCRPLIYSLWIRLLFRHPLTVQKTADGYVSLLRETGFVIDPVDVSSPTPPWSRPDFGISGLFGRSDRPGTNRLVCLAAYRPA